MNDEYLLLQLPLLQAEIDTTNKRIDIKQQQIEDLIQTNTEQRKELERIKKTLRIVCIDTENPIHF